MRKISTFQMYVGKAIEELLGKQSTEDRESFLVKQSIGIAKRRIIGMLADDEKAFYLMLKSSIVHLNKAVEVYETENKP